MTEDTLKKIQSEIEKNKILLFMKGTPETPRCGFSAATVEILKSYPYAFKGIDVLSNPDIREALPNYSNWPTFPQLFVGGKLVGGCDIVSELNESGELKTILEEVFKN